MRCDPPPEAAARVGPVGVHNLAIYLVRVNTPQTRVYTGKRTLELKSTKKIPTISATKQFGMNVSSNIEKCVSNGETDPYNVSTCDQTDTVPAHVFSPTGRNGCGARKGMCREARIASGGWCSSSNSQNVCAPTQHFPT